ncbi:MAG: hypothetical protein JXA20_08690 [Spirochaetes bacterium]|nr:hypothetical protein [Spirochaetota bacterium]
MKTHTIIHLVSVLLLLSCDYGLSPAYYAPFLDTYTCAIMRLDYGGTITYGDTLTFPDTSVGSTSDIDITVCNDDTDNDLGPAGYMADNTTDYTIVNNGASYIAPSACIAAKITITFQPKNASLCNGTVIVNSNDATYKNFIIYVKGTGL